MDMEITFPGGLGVDAHLGPLTVHTDQDGSAPAPFGLFLASIGTCAGIYVLSFCKHRGLSTEGVRVVQRVHANPVTHMVTSVDLDIVVPPDFPERYHAALVRAADQCAVKKHLEQPPTFNVQTRVEQPTISPRM